MVEAIYYPETRTGYWFGDEDQSSNGASYSSYGMIAKVSERRRMICDCAERTMQAFISRHGTGNITRERTYDYPLNPDFTLAGAPTYRTVTETWEAMNGGAAVTRYAVHRPRTPAEWRDEVTRPDGSRAVTYYRNPVGTSGPDPLARLPYKNEIYAENSQQPSRQIVTTWVAGAGGTPQRRREDVIDERGLSTATTYGYGPPLSYGPGEEYLEGLHEYEYAIEFDFNFVRPLRRTLTRYVTDREYTSRHFLRLPKAVEVWEFVGGGDGERLASNTEYDYDRLPLERLGGEGFAEGHDLIFNPYLFPEPPPPQFKFRGNVTEIRRYADAATRRDPVTESRHYDVTGNVVQASTTACELETFTYAPETPGGGPDPSERQYAYLFKHTCGAADPASSVRLTTRATYDRNTGLVLSTTDANGRTTETFYDDAALRPTTVTWPTRATTTYTYDDLGLAVTAETKTDTGVAASRSKTWTDGRGLVRRQETLAGDGNWDVVERRYDLLGRLSAWTSPLRLGAGQPLPQDAPLAQIEYDALGRVTRTTSPDKKSETKSVYDQVERPPAALPGPGRTTLVTDAWGRQRWISTDALSRLQQVVEPNPDRGNSSVLDDPDDILTTYTYDALDQLIQAETKTSGSNVSQRRTFAYDSLGRLTRESLPERDPGLDDTGRYSTSAIDRRWTDAYRYDTRSNLTSHTDARGVTTTYSYHNASLNRSDPLNRLQRISYTLPTCTTGLQGLAVGQNADGRLEVFGLAPDGSVQHTWQVAASGAWNGSWQPFYSAGGQPQSCALTDSPPILEAKSVSYAYREPSAANPTEPVDVTRPAKVTITDVGEEEYEYDSESRLKSTTLTLANRQAFSQITTYDYDGLNRLTGITYPAEYGVSDNPSGRSARITYDNASQPLQLTFDGVPFASSIAYNAAGQPSSLSVGSALGESYEYDPVTGLLHGQRVLRSGKRLLDLTYEHQRRGASGNLEGGRTGQLTSETFTREADDGHPPRSSLHP